jgi:hypothetical protein
MTATQIKIWMLQHSVKAAVIASELNVTKQAIYNFIAGRSYSDRIRAHFIELGCPDKILPHGKRYGRLAA